MRLLRLVRVSFGTLAGHRARSALALCGVAIGTGALVTAGALGRAAELRAAGGFSSLGTNLLVVRPAQVKRLVGRPAVKGIASSLRPEDAHAIARLPSVAGAAAAVERALRVRSEQAVTVTKVQGTQPGFVEVRRLRVESGRPFDAGDEREARRVVVLGARVRESLFAGEPAVGRMVRIDGVPFEVIGTLQARGASPEGGDEDNQVFVPLRTALRRVYNTPALSLVFVDLRRPELAPEAERQVRALLRDRHRLEAADADDFGIQNPLRLVASQRATARSFALLASGLAAVVLAVAGSGILALMLLSVKERTGEIGLRLALGATPRDILVQFLAEATLLSLAGGALGVLFGAVAARELAAATGWPTPVPADAVLAALAAASSIGLVFGALPARRAARWMPAEALAAE